MSSASAHFRADDGRVGGERGGLVGPMPTVHASFMGLRADRSVPFAVDVVPLTAAQGMDPW